MATDKGGGNAHHRPDCNCFACRRKKEAIARTAGGSPLSNSGLGAALQVFTPEEAQIAPIELSELGPDGLPQTVIEGDILEVPGRGPRHRIGQWMQMRHADPTLTNAECAKKMGIATCTLNTYISKAHRAGWLRFSEPLARIEHEIIPQTLDNLAFYLSKEGGRDKQVTIETAKGVIFKQYLDSKGISEAPQTVLALKIETVDAGQVKVSSGHVVGTPRMLDLPTLTLETIEQDKLS